MRGSLRFRGARRQPTRRHAAAIVSRRHSSMARAVHTRRLSGQSATCPGERRQRATRRPRQQRMRRAGPLSRLPLRPPPARSVHQLRYRQTARPVRRTASIASQQSSARARNVSVRIVVPSGEQHRVRCRHASFRQGADGARSSGKVRHTGRAAVSEIHGAFEYA